MTTANKVTVLRMLLIPFFVAGVLYYGRTGEEMFRLGALLCFAVAAICDGVDGYIARRYRQSSELGVMLDPLADKLLLVSAVVVLSFEHGPNLARLPLWLVVTVVGRDLLLLAGLLVIHIAVGRIKVRPRLVGKAATVLQMAAVLWVLLQWPDSLLRYIVIAAAVCTAVSGVWYVFDGMKQVASHPASSPTPK